MAKDAFRQLDSDTLKEKRKKIYQLKPDMSLSLEKREKDKSVRCGILNAGDLVYVVSKKKQGDKTILSFKVMSLADSVYRDALFTASSEYFKPYSWVDKSYSGFVAKENAPKKGNNWGVPVITTVGFGTIGYLLGEKFQKNKFYCAIGGAVLGAVLGYMYASKPTFIDYEKKIIEELNPDEKLSSEKIKQIKSELSKLSDDKKSATLDYIKDIYNVSDGSKTDKELKKAIDKIDSEYEAKYGLDDLKTFKSILKLA